MILSINSRIQTAKENGASIPEGTTIGGITNIHLPLPKVYTFLDNTAESESDAKKAAVVPEQKEETKISIAVYWIIIALMGVIVAILVKYLTNNTQ